MLMSRGPRSWKELRFQLLLLMGIFVAIYAIISLVQFVKGL